MAVELSILRMNLEHERKRLIEELEELDDNSDKDHQSASSFNKTGESADAATNLERRLALASHKRINLAAIDRALKKIDAGTYGMCEDCGQPIDPVRLEALPHTINCLVCSSAKTACAIDKVGL